MTTDIRPSTAQGTDDRRDARKRSSSGFTLIELLVVLVILGLLLGLVGPQVVKYLAGAKSDTARLQVEQLAAAMDLFLIDIGRYPSESEGIDALVEAPQGLERWNGPYLRKDTVPLDPWGNPYHYRIDGESGRFTIYSLGADNAEGGDGENQDIRL